MQVIFQIKTFHAYNKNCISVSVSPTKYYASQFTQDAISILPWFICIIYLHVTETYLKQNGYVLFLQFGKPFKYYEKRF